MAIGSLGITFDDSIEGRFTIRWISINQIGKQLFKEAHLEYTGLFPGSQFHSGGQKERSRRSSAVFWFPTSFGSNFDMFVLIDWLIDVVEKPMVVCACIEFYCINSWWRMYLRLNWCIIVHGCKMSFPMSYIPADLYLMVKIQFLKTL